jgi:hypothetical protein
MQVIPKIEKGLINILLLSAFVGCNFNSDKGNNLRNEIKIKQDVENYEVINKKSIKESPWKNIEEYDNFVRSTVNRYYESDVKEIYDFYDIKRELPTYGFKSKDLEFMCFDCTGAVYKENSDSIYFYYNCSEELFKRFIEYNKSNKEDIEEYFIDKIHHYIKHEAGHAFYFDLGKILEAKYLFDVDYKNSSILYNIQHSLVEEGVAEYIAYKGKLTESAKKLDDSSFKEMIESKNDFYLYDLGFILVKPILDKDFHKGIEELIKNPLSEKDLKDLLKYQEKILNKL